MVFNYPEVRRDEEQSECLHGKEVKDPYRWLEDPDSEETKQFVKAQNDVSMPYIESCEDLDNIKKRITELWDYPKYGCPFKRGDKYFFFMNTGLQNQYVLYIQDSLNAEPKVFFDPNLLSEDGTVSLRLKAFSDDGEIFAYGLSESGSDWSKIKFRKVSTMEDYPEELENIRYSGISWTHDNKGIFYSRYNPVKKADGTLTESNENQKLYYHKLGTPQSEDMLAVEFPKEPKWMVTCSVSDCGKYVIVSVSEGCKNNLVYLSDLSKLNGNYTNLPLVPIVTEFEADYNYITNTDALFIFQTDKDASNSKLISIDINNPSRENWKTLLAEHPTDVLDWVTCVRNDLLVVCYMKDVKNILQIRSLETAELLKTFPLEVGTITGFSGKKKQAEVFYNFSSFLTPGIIYHCDLTAEGLDTKVFKEISLKDFDAGLYETNQVFYKGKDETRIPMFVIHKKGLKMDGTNPCFMYGYGGFNVSLQPGFSITYLTFAHHFGGVMAIPNIRGGGEYGEKWHKGGSVLNKQNCFDDFIAAGEYLISAGYTQPKKLAICGGSNGGLLVGACINQKPELFGAAIAQVGVMDMLRFHKFTIGHAWMTDYGNPDEEEHFNNVFKFSPLHNVRKPPGDVEYPATLLLTADHDDRVVPLHSFKFISELQYRLGKQSNPLMIRVETKAGHGAGKPTAKVIEEKAHTFAFIARALGLKFIRYAKL